MRSRGAAQARKVAATLAPRLAARMNRMSNRPRIGGLGRGLGALIPTAPVEIAPPADDAPAVAGEVAGEPPTPAPNTASSETADDAGPELVPVDGAQFLEIPVSAIRANAKQPRQVFDEDAL